MHLEAEPFLEPGAGALTSPQFDDEKTLLSARPVVPLAEVSKARFRRQLPFVVGIGFLAIILCAVVLIQFSRADDKSQTGSSSRMGPSDRSPAKTSESVTDGGSVDSLSNDSSSNPEPRNPAVAAVTQPDEKPAANRFARRSKAQLQMLSARRVHEDNGDGYDLDQQTRRELRREARRAERRAQRAAERARETGNGVFRITDLFEGARRP